MADFIKKTIMITLEITTTVGCKVQCSFCPQKKFMSKYHSSKKGEVRRYMSLPTFKKCIDKVPKNVGIAFVGFSEPFLNPNCTEMILYAYQKGHQVFLFTTLMGLEVSDLKLLLKKVKFHPFDDQAGVIIHLPSEGNIEQIVVDDKYIKLLKMIMESDLRVDFHYHGNEINSKLKNVIPEDLCLHRPINSRAGNVDLRDSGGEFVEQPDEIKRKRGSIMCNWASKKVDGKFELNGHNLLPDGRVVLCCMDYGMKHVLGNLLVSSWRSLHNSKEFNLVMKGLEDESLDILCRTCHHNFDTDTRAIFYNSDLSIKNLYFKSKVLLFNKMNWLYGPLRSAKQFLTFGKKHEKDAEEFLKL